MKELQEKYLHMFKNLCLYKYQLQEAFNYLFCKKISHEDLESDNVMISNDNNVKLIDFGEAKTVSKEEKCPIIDNYWFFDFYAYLLSLSPL